MITGVHAVIFSRDAEGLRTMLGDVLGFESVDAGGGWLIFAMPPSELAVHPGDAPGAELYLMCEDLAAAMSALDAKGIHCSEVQELSWGLLTRITLPGGGKLGLYQPRHPTASDRELISEYRNG